MEMFIDGEHSIVGQRIDRQLTKVTLIQIVLVIFAMSPYGIYTAYSLLTSQLTETSNHLFQQ